MNAAAPVDLDGEELLSVLEAAVTRAFGQLRRSVQKNLAVLTVAFLRVLGAARNPTCPPGRTLGSRETALACCILQ